MYRIQLLDLTGSDVLLAFSNARVRGWSKRINAAGRLEFSLPYGDPQATATNLRKYGRVRLLRRDSSGVYTPAWYGYIEAHKRQGLGTSVACAGMLDLFKKRFTGDDEAFNGEGSTEAFGLLSDCNGDDDTGIVAGTGGVTTTRNLTAQGRIEVFRAWELLAQAHDAEFQVTDDGAFDFVPALGTDQSALITFVFRRDGTPGSNVEDTEEGEDGRDMANRLYAETTGGSGFSYTWDGTTQATYGVLAERKQFNEAQDLAALQAMAAAYGSQRENPVSDYRLIPVMASKIHSPSTGTLRPSGHEYGDVSIGDLVGVEIHTEGETSEEARRVAEIAVEVDDELRETVRYTLSESGVFVTAAYLDADEIGALKRRIAELEALI